MLIPVWISGFYDVLLHDMTDADAPYVAVSDLSDLRQEWPALVVFGMTGHQLELEQMRHDGKKQYRGTQTGLCTFYGKVIILDLARHVANYHLKFAQLWRCPVSWCTIWKGTPQDCVDHFVWPMWCLLWRRRLTWDVGSHHGQFPGMSGTKPSSPLYLECQRMRICSARVACHWYIVIVCSVERGPMRGNYMVESQIYPDIQHGVRRREPEDLSPRCKSRWALSPSPATL